MRISLLMEREPFGSILERTLSRFWSAQMGVPCEVHWGAGTGQAWRYNARLNSIFAADADAAIFESVRREFSRAPQAWRRPLQSAYVTAATHRPGRGLLSRPAISVSPAVPDAKHLLMLGGNNRIRILDRAHGLSHVIAKHGFDEGLLAAELRVRKANPSLPVPEIVDADPEDRWFTERYVLGTPLNRLGDQVVVRDALTRVREAVIALQAATSADADPAGYAASVADRATVSVERIRWLDPAQRTALYDAATALREAAGARAGDVSRFATAVSHGDFWQANMLWDGTDCWLIDWENTARRQLAYDPLVLELASRFPAGLAARLAAALDDAPPSGALAAWPGLDWGERPSRRIQLALFMLEELEFHATEAANPLFTSLAPGFDVFACEFETAAEALVQA